MAITRVGSVVSGLAIVALLLGACGTDDAGSTASTTASPVATSDAGDATAFTTQDAIDAAETFEQAYNTQDANLFRETTTEDFRFVQGDGVLNRSSMEGNFPAMRQGNFQVNRTDDLVTVSEDPFVVAADAVVTAVNFDPLGLVGTTTYTLVEEAGVLKVQEHEWAGDPIPY